MWMFNVHTTLIGRLIALIINNKIANRKPVVMLVPSTTEQKVGSCKQIVTGDGRMFPCPASR